MPKRTALFCSVVVVSATTLLAPRATAQGAADRSTGYSQSTTAIDSEILSKLHHINQMEIQLGQLAQQKASSSKVKNYGERLVRDHERADREVTSLAQRLNIQLAVPQPRTSDEAQKMHMHEQMADKLKGMSGRAFDSTFLQTMVQGHQDAIAMLSDAEGQLSSPVKDLVTNLLPTLRQHEIMAADLQKSTT